VEFAACESIGPLSPFPRENRYLSGTPDFGPTNEHELAIARIVDQFATAGKLDGSVIDLLASVLPFTMADGDTKFLVRYIRWRMEHPIVK